MPDIRIRELPTASPAVGTDWVPIDNGSTRKVAIQDLVSAGRPLASQAEAEAGTDPVKAMTPLTTKQAVTSYGLTKDGNLAGLTDIAIARTNLGLGSAATQPSSAFATAAQGLLADTAIQPALFDARAPAFSANTILVDNPTGTARESKTFQEVREILAVPKIIPTIASLSGFTPITAPDFIRTEGYTTVGDDGGALYKKVASEPSHAGKFSVTQFNTTVVWYELAEFFVSPQMFGAIGDATDIGVGTDDTVAIDNWFSFLIAVSLGVGKFSKSYRYAPSGTVKVWNVAGANEGFSILGKEKNRDGLFLDAGKALAIEGSNSFYHRFEHFRVLGNYDSGPVFRIGKDDFSDAFNGCSFLLTINNNSLNDNCEGMRVNYVLQSDFFCTVNCGGSGAPGHATTPGHGKALVLRQATFNRFMVACGQANIGLYMTAGAIFANTFVAIDMEEVATAIKCDAVSASKNEFVSGQILGTTTLDCTAGDQTIFHSGCNLVNYVGGSLGTNLVGVEIIRRAPRSQAAVTNPTMPASTVYFKNTTGMKMFVIIWAGTYTLVNLRSPDGGVLGVNNQVNNEATSVVLHPNWEIAITYTSAPAWRWFPG